MAYSLGTWSTGPCQSVSSHKKWAKFPVYIIIVERMLYLDPPVGFCDFVVNRVGQTHLLGTKKE